MCAHKNIPWFNTSFVGGGGSGKGRPAITEEGGVVFVDVIFLGSVLDLLSPFKLFDPLLRKDAWLDAVLPTPGESGIEPFLSPFLGGAIGPPWSPFGGRGGREDDTCSSSAWKDKVYIGVDNERINCIYFG